LGQYIYFILFLEWNLPTSIS